MSEEATIEDEAEEELSSSRPQTKTGLLPWSYILEIVSKEWVMFFILSIAIGIFLYVSARQRRNKKETSSAIRDDHVQSGNKGISRKSPKRE